MYADLGENAAVLFNNTLTVRLKGEIAVDGVVLEDGRQHHGRNVTVGKDSKLIRITKKPKEVLYYENLEGLMLTLERKVALREECTGVYDEYDECYKYESLEQEFEFRKKSEELDKYKPVYSEEVEVRTPIDIKVVGTLEDTGSPYIETPVMHGAVTWKGAGERVNSSAGIYKCNKHQIIMEKLKALEAEYKDNVKFDIPTHSGFEFVKVGSRYIFDRRYSDIKDKYFTELGDAQHYVEDLQKKIDKAVLDVVSPVGLDKVSASEVSVKLKRLHEKVSCLQVKQASKVSRFEVARLVTDIQEYVDKAIDKERGIK